MTNRTVAQDVVIPRKEAETRRVLWMELPQRAEPDPATARYDVAALHEEPERWDGMA